MNFFAIVCWCGIGANIAHVLQEAVHGFAAWLCSLLGIETPRWLSPVLSLSALANTSGPLALALWLGEGKPFAYCLVAYAMGGLWGDILTSHVVPALATQTHSPGSMTWPLHLGVPVVWALTVASAPAAPLLAGMASFAGLWPALWLLRRQTLRG